MNTIQVTNLLQDYMFTADNLKLFTKHIIQLNLNIKESTKNILQEKNIPMTKEIKEIKNNIPMTIEQSRLLVNNRNRYYKPRQKDSLFWCFYILKNGYSNYEMDISNKYFTVERTEKYRYIEILRNNKDKLKIHNIKPFTEIEDDLGMKDKISVKTFFALCVYENINVLLVNRRKIYEIMCVDNKPINIIHKNNYEHSIELNVTESILNNYKNTYYKPPNLDASLKSISSYTVSELTDICKKLDINIPINEDGKKKSKKDIYELLVLNY
jgi:hypothetical protein